MHVSTEQKYRVSDGTTYSNEANVVLFLVTYPGPTPDAYYTTPKDTLLSDKIYAYPTVADLYELLSPPSNGILTLHTRIFGEYDGTFDYMPNPGYTGVDQFIMRHIYDSAHYGFCPGDPFSVTIDVQEPTPTPTPEFPSSFLPVTLIIGFVGAVFLIQKTKEN